LKGIYPKLEWEIFVKGIKYKAIASNLKISERALRNKMKGLSPLYWMEACSIQKTFFPDIDKDTLFATDEDKTA